MGLTVDEIVADVVVTSLTEGLVIIEEYGDPAFGQLAPSFAPLMNTDVPSIFDAPVPSGVNCGLVADN